MLLQKNVTENFQSNQQARLFLGNGEFLGLERNESVIYLHALNHTSRNKYEQVGKNFLKLNEYLGK